MKKLCKFDEFDNDIGKMQRERLEHIRQLNSLDNSIESKEEARRDYGLRYYGNKEKRKTLLIEARAYGYSEERIRELFPYVETWNQDCVTNDILDRFRLVEKFVEENKQPYQKSFFYKLSRVMDGGVLNEN